MNPSKAGLWLGFEELLQLPLEANAKADLWRLALRQRPNAAAAEQLPLVIALARFCGQASAAAAADGQWVLMQQQLEETVGSYRRIAELDPGKTSAVREEIGNLIAKLVSVLHNNIYSMESPDVKERSKLCWQGFQLCISYHRLELEQPDWLWHLEEQLVREGAISLRQLISTESIESKKETNQQALELLLHLGKMHKPCPEWILIAAREQIEFEVQTLLINNNQDNYPKEDDLKKLFSWIARLPLAIKELKNVQLAVQRGIWSLQLHSQQEEISDSAKTKPEKKETAPIPRKAIAAQASPTDPRHLYRAITIAVETWLSDHPAQLNIHRLEPIFRTGQEAVQWNEGCLQFNIASLLAFPQIELLDQLVPAFFMPLQKAGRGKDFNLVQPHSAIWKELGAFWHKNGELNRTQFSGLVYFTALWNRCGGKGGLEAKTLGWELPVSSFMKEKSLLRPGNVELAALQTVLFQADELEVLLAEIRRRHHDHNWMESKRDEWWYNPNDGYENLKRLHTNAGFYASSHAPLESLQRWSQGTIRALLSGPILFGNESITEMFWPLAQQLFKQTGNMPALVQWPGDQEFYNFISGKELLFVTPLASDVETHHRTGLAFNLFSDIQIQPYGLRCIEAPVSIYPNRPDRGFEDSLERTLEQIDRIYRQKPFEIFTAACGAYGLPLCEIVKQRYGVNCIYVGNLMHAYFGLLQNTTANWRIESRINENWISSSLLNNIPGVNKIEGGRYLKLEN